MTMFRQFYRGVEINFRNTCVLKSIIDRLVLHCDKSKEQRKFVMLSFLQKLINSLEILSIMGVSSATNYIHACITKERENNNKNKSWHSADMEKLIQFEKSICGYEGKSNKIEFLLKYISDESKFDKNSRIIIFVRARKTARYLCDFLREDKKIKETWNPCIFVGHAHHDGMEWFGEQEVALDKFRDNDCRLFVATNVLQVKYHDL